MAKAPTIKPPSLDDINLVLQAASTAPLHNLKHAAALDKALTEVERFFRALHEPQSKGSGGGSRPQASAKGAGSSSDQA